MFMRFNYKCTAIIPILLFQASLVHAETTDCTAITSLPYTINTQGIYCLIDKISTNITTGNAIEITVNNVTIDLNENALGGLGAGTATTAVGIYAYQKKNITIKNGVVRGFRTGIHLDDDASNAASTGNVVQGILADQNRQIGIRMEGTGNAVLNSRVVNTGGTPAEPDLNSRGILLAGPGGKMRGNSVSGTYTLGTGNSFANGIVASNANGVFIHGNGVFAESVVANTRGIVVTNSSVGAIVRNNDIVNTEIGINFSSGGTGKYWNNLTTGVTTPFSGGTPIGNNNN